MSIRECEVSNYEKNDGMKENLKKNDFKHGGCGKTVPKIKLESHKI